MSYQYRIGGRLDSVDLISGAQSSTLPGGGFNTWNNLVDPTFFIQNKNGQLFWNYSNPVKLTFSGLPHLGVAYLFGSNAQQYLKSEYQQVFRYNVTLNARYIKNLSNGILRKSAFSHNDVSLILQKRGKIYSAELHSSYVTSNVSQSGGVSQDSLADLYDLSLIPVNRTQSETKTRRFSTGLTNYIDFDSDSSRAIGILTRHTLRIKKYELNETDTLYGIYPMINFDSTTTYDRHQLSAFSNAAGLYVSNQLCYFSALTEANYWRFYNLGRSNDTLEVNMNAEFSLKRRSMKVHSIGSFNVLGAKNEWSNQSSIAFNLGKQTISLNLLNQSILPEPYQRYAIGNSTLPVSGEFEKQFFQNYSFRYERNLNRTSVNALLGYVRYQNNYWFLDSIWRNDTLNNLFDFYFQPSISYDWKVIHLNFSYRLNFLRENMDFLPGNQLALRVYLKGGLFKGKKMKAYGGGDFGYSGSYQQMDYRTQLMIFSQSSSEVLVQPLHYIHLFGGFEVSTFRFFFRVENIQSYWWKRSVQTFTKFPVSPMQIKIGITWDFFD